MKAKRSPSKQSHTKSFDKLIASRAIISLLIVLLALAVLLLFSQYQENIIANGMFAPFIALTVVGMGLLVSLLFLINPSKAKK